MLRRGPCWRLVHRPGRVRWVSGRRRRCKARGLCGQPGAKTPPTPLTLGSWPSSRTESRPTGGVSRVNEMLHVGCRLPAPNSQTDRKAPGWSPPAVEKSAVLPVLFPNSRSAVAPVGEGGSKVSQNPLKTHPIERSFPGGYRAPGLYDPVLHVLPSEHPQATPSGSARTHKITAPRGQR